MIYTAVGCQPSDVCRVSFLFLRRMLNFVRAFVQTVHSLKSYTWLYRCGKMVQIVQQSPYVAT